MMLFDLKKQFADALAKTEGLIKTAEAAGRNFTADESKLLEDANKEMDALAPQIASIERNNTLRTQFGARGPVVSAPGAAAPAVRRSNDEAPVHFTRDYAADFMAYITSGGKNMGAALYEGSNAAGGYAVPIVVDDQIVPLAPQEMAIRQLAMVIPTSSDIKFPSKLAFGTAAITAELGTFTGTAPTLEQFTLSAFMAGVLNALSWELVQDVPAFQSFVVQDMVLAQQMFEENLYTNGTGSGQAQGLIGNTGTGVTVDPDANGNIVGISGVLDLIGTLNAHYHPNARFLMSRQTSIGIRKAQVQSNLFNPAWTNEGKQDYLFGYPVYYSGYMPAAARGATPVLFGDFKQGYLIGDRGGSGINVKVLDQPLASQGQLQLLTYRRTDGRVRRSEAIQAYTSTASGSSSPE